MNTVHRRNFIALSALFSGNKKNNKQTNYSNQLSIYPKNLEKAQRKSECKDQ